MVAGLLWVSFVLAGSAQTALYRWNKPAWAPTPVVPADNPMSEAKVRLGRALFYERRLSIDGSMSCGSCHQQSKAFTDGQAVHAGVNGELGRRSSMTLTNVAFRPSYTWANPSMKSLEQQMLLPLFSDHPIEMGMQGKEQVLLRTIAEDDTYSAMFRAAFPEKNGEVSIATLTKALAAFERTLLSFNSPYDRYKHGAPNALSAAAKRGESLFFGERLECYHCHDGVDFTDNHMQQGQAFPETGFHNTGLYNVDGFGGYKKEDSGLREVTENEEDEGRFRTPTLRNIAITGPYMHDGSIRTLEEVIRKHYAVKGRAALAGKGPSPLRSEFIEGFQIRDREVKDLVEFLKSLTDAQFLADPAFADPNLRPVVPAIRRPDAE
jgi:cytochrome c peroxidase